MSRHLSLVRPAGVLRRQAGQQGEVIGVFRLRAHEPVEAHGVVPESGPLTGAQEERLAELIRRGVLAEGATADEMRQMLEKMSADFRDGAPLSAAGAATIILDGVLSGAWRILVGQDAVGLDGYVRAKPEDAYDYALLASMAAQNAGGADQGEMT